MTRFKNLFVEFYSFSSKVIRCKNYGPIHHQFFQRSKSTSTFDNFGKYRKTEGKSKHAKEKRNKTFPNLRVKSEIRQNTTYVLRAHAVFSNYPSYYFSDMEIDDKILKKSNEILNLPMSKFIDKIHETPLADLLLFIFALSKIPQESLIENFW